MVLRRLRRRIVEVRRRNKSKGDVEIDYWRRRHRAENRLRNEHYEHFFTGHFGLTRADYRGKRVLDLGCGPRGSLEWASEAAERVGLDPLVERYRDLGIDRHAMDYVAASAEAIPFPDGHFDIVTSFNSLDHVDDVDASVRELTRVTKDGGLLLLIVEVNHAPTKTEPHELGWDVVEHFDGFRVVSRLRTAVDVENPGHYRDLEAGRPWESGPGLLTARLERLPA